MSFKNNFTIKDLNLSHNIIYAPLAEYTDFAFRRLVRNYHTSLMYCEMVKMQALVREKTTKLLKYTKDMKPLGAQLSGADPSIAFDSAKKLEDSGFDTIDLNCGCPVHKVVKDGSGAALLKEPKLISQILSEMVKAVKIPVTIKIRLGWDDSSIVATDIVKIAIDAGCSAITIHGRTRKQGYSGKSDWNYITECKKVAQDNILVFANGDLYSAEDVKNVFELTKCDGVMIARGMLFSPWLSNDIESYYTNSIKPSFSRKEAILKYISYLLDEKKENAIFDLRRISGWFFRGIENIKNLRISINAATNIDQAIKLIEGFDFDERDNSAPCSL